MHEVDTNEGNPAHLGEVKDIMTLTKGKQVNEPSPPLLNEKKICEKSKNFGKGQKVSMRLKRKLSKNK